MIINSNTPLQQFGSLNGKIKLTQTNPSKTENSKSIDEPVNIGQKENYGTGKTGWIAEWNMAKRVNIMQLKIKYIINHNIQKIHLNLQEV